MLAAVLRGQSGRPQSLNIMRVPKPASGDGEVHLEVLACGVCRTDLHIARDELGPHKIDLIPGHQIRFFSFDLRGL